MKWCCGVFEGTFSEAGERGIAVLVDRRSDGTPIFLIQSRAITLGAPYPQDSPSPLTLVSETGIAFCPWCGARLKDFYRDQIDLMIRPGFIDSALSGRL